MWQICEQDYLLTELWTKLDESFRVVDGLRDKKVIVVVKF